MPHDFYKIISTINKLGQTELYPDFLVSKSKEYYTRGGGFYAVLDKNTGLWSMNETKVAEIIDSDLYSEKEKLEATLGEGRVVVKDLANFHNRMWLQYRSYSKNLPDNYVQLDEKLCFKNTPFTAADHVSKVLSYSLQDGPHDSWDKLLDTLYEPTEREKIEWAIGSVISGDSKTIQKFFVFYGSPGSGKGTILEIVRQLFEDYCTVFDAKMLASASNNFPFEQFRDNPLVAIQLDGDLSKVYDNTKLNTLVSHEPIVMNVKGKSTYILKPHCILFLASNNPVEITNAKSGLLRRLIDIHPSNKTLPSREYDYLMSQIKFELSGIAWHCLNVYKNLGKNYYKNYKAFSMIEKTNPFYNFVYDNYDIFSDEEGISLKDAYEIYRDHCDKNGYNYPMARYLFKDELSNYFTTFEERHRMANGDQVRSWFSGFMKEKFTDGSKGSKEIKHSDKTFGLVLDQKKSLLDELLKDCQAQYAEDDGHGGSKPILPWDKVTTTLKDIDTSKLHFVRLPKNHIVIDFDLKNEQGEKDALLNLEAADKWPKTYAEYSQGGKGIHLHYFYDGDPNELATLYSKDIEVKISKGKSALRRRLSLCNAIAVALLSCGLPKKEVKDTLDFESVKDEKHIRNIIAKCLKKEIAQPYTAPAMSLIKKTLDDAYAAGIKYDIRDLRPAISAFAAKSHHQKDICIKMANDLNYLSKHFDDDHKWDGSSADKAIKAEIAKKEPEDIHEKIIPQYVDETLVFFDIEVFPNLLLVNWKEAGEEKGVVRMINPSREEIAQLLKRKLVGFNCRRYDNHILYARYLNYDNDAIYRLSQRIIGESKNCMFGNAYDISYTDVYDFAATKQSLKKWEIELGIHHQELGLPWDQPVPENRWAEVAEYCDNDVIATEAVFNHLAGDFKAREILADIAGMTVNDTTNMLTTKIIFGDDPSPQRQFNYPNLAKKFPGYIFQSGKSYYRHKQKVDNKNFDHEIQKLVNIYGEDHVHINDKNEVEVDELIGEGGRVYSKPGIYHNVVTYDVASMHPSSIIAENGFGKYTERFKQLLDIRIAIKHKDFETAKQMLNGKLAKYLTNKDQAKALSQALKIAINSVYGLTAAGFDNKFRDPRNKDNWVAKRGALFMEELRLKVQAMGATVVHIKTDSIKIENPTQEVTDYILNRGKEYGYTFEVEDIYEKICLVNDAVYVALRDKQDPGWLDECDKAKKKANEEKKPYKEPTRWTATGAQFQHPYVFKTLFSHQPIEFKDLCETKTVTSALYLDMNENLTDVSAEEKEKDKLVSRIKKLTKALNENESKHNLSSADIEKINAELNDLPNDISILNEIIAKGHKYVFVGKAGSFCPMKSGLGGGILVREKDGKYSAATGTTGYRWREGESINGSNRMDLIDMKYFNDLAEKAIIAINEFGPFEQFINEEVSQTMPPLSIDEVLDESDKAFSLVPWDQ